MEYINKNDYTEDIINILKEHPKGLSTTEIAKILGVHRHTIAKYIYQLVGTGIIQQRKIGPAKLCYLKKGFEKEKRLKKK